MKGDVIYLEILGRPIVLLQSAQAVIDLLDKQSGIYSDRPHMVMAGELFVFRLSFAAIDTNYSQRCGMQKIAPLTRFGTTLRKQRKLMQRALNPRAITRYEHIQEREISLLLDRLLVEPQRFASHIRRRVTGFGTGLWSSQGLS